MENTSQGEEKEKWLIKNNVDYFKNEFGTMSIRLEDIPLDKRQEFHNLCYSLQKKYEKINNK